MGNVAENYRRVRAAIPEDVALVVAAKGRTPDEVREVIEAGARIIGENYVQEAEQAAAALGDAARQVEWHMIGHLQRNKVSKAIPVFDVVQTVDSMRLASALDARAQRPLRVYLEVNIGGEESKSGMSPDEVEQFIKDAGSYANINITGLMTIAPESEDPETSRPYFHQLRDLRDRLQNLQLTAIYQTDASVNISARASIPDLTSSLNDSPKAILFGCIETAKILRLSLPVMSKSVNNLIEELWVESPDPEILFNESTFMLPGAAAKSAASTNMMVSHDVESIGNI